MSAINGVIAGLFLALIVTVVGLIYWNHHETIKNVQTKVELNEAKTLINQLDTSLKVNDEVVSGVIEQTRVNTQKKQKILQDVDNTTKQVDNEEITPVSADAAYLNSMWSAYCTYNKDTNGCTTRQSTDSMHNG